MRFDGHRYIHCRWCRGRGCLACEAEFEKDYRKAFPEGPQPIATFQLDSPEDMDRLGRLFGPETVTKYFGTGGLGMEAFLRDVAASAQAAARAGEGRHG